MCLMIYELSGWVSRLVVRRSESGSGESESQGEVKSRRRIRNGLYWMVMMVIVALYSQRTIQRNPDWKDDATLHLSSLSVCSRSAKLQLQVTKLKLNEGKFEEAAMHVALAKEIDPEFCDVWYQEALLNIAYYNDMDTAIEKLADSLQCIFTNTGELRAM
jgi:hypothetical protein